MFKRLYDFGKNTFLILCHNIRVDIKIIKIGTLNPLLKPNLTLKNIKSYIM